MLNPYAAAHRCPVCDSVMRARGRPYTLDELFALWEPITFSDATIAAHRKQADRTQLHACPTCGLEMYFPSIIGTPEFYSEAYNLESTQADSAFTYADHKWEFDQAIRDAAGCRRVFEFGCGSGNFLALLRARGFDAEGSEYNLPALERARARGLRVTGPEEVLRTAAGSWDAAFSFHVLEHTADPVGFVREMVRAVKPNGLVGICVPDQSGPLRHIEPCIMNMPPHHASRWRLATFETLAKRLDLTIRRVAYEPLLLENHSYYSVHWAHAAVRGSSRLSSSARSALSMVLRGCFGGMRRFGVRRFPLLRGQSIYVLMGVPGA